MLKDRYYTLAAAHLFHGEQLGHFATSIYYYLLTVVTRTILL